MTPPPPTPLNSLLPYEAQLASGGPRVRELVRDAISWSALALGTIVRVATREPAIALTFDDGPHPEETPRVLEILERHGARGTFFMIGKNARRHPEVVARALEAGHAVANHSWDHPSFRRIQGRYRRAQIRWCGEALGPQGARLFRPPYGEQSLGSRLDALACGYQVVCWDVVAEDWEDRPADHLVQRVMRRLRRGSIVVFHDALHTTTEERFRDRGPTRQALETLLGRLAGSFRFVTVPELLRLGRPVRWHHYHRLPLDFHRDLV
jgi:peptidoglycan/xylan/chitin deacetylase (PgdA/CDA1 family)